MAMTPLQIITAARQRYNAVNDDFWSDAEMYNLVYQACNKMTVKGLTIEQTYSTTSVLGQQEYIFPTQALNIKRATYNGAKLSPFDFRDDDVLTILDAATQTLGTPTHYAQWNNTIYLRAVPDTAGLTIKLFAHVYPQTVSATSTLEFPRGFEMAPVNYLLSEMSAKNKNFLGAKYYLKLWEDDIKDALELQRRNKIADGFNIVKNVDTIHQSDLGLI